MRVITSILLIALLLFNWIGYRFVVNYLQQRADHQQEARIDLNNYEDSQLIEIRVALNMPYQAMNTSFERHYGEIEMGGKYYTYVKRKIEDGCLVLKCLPNHEKELINTFLKTTNGSSKDAAPASKPIKYSTNDFDNDKPFFQLHLPVLATELLTSATTALTTPGFISTITQPPEAAAAA